MEDPQEALEDFNATSIFASKPSPKVSLLPSLYNDQNLDFFHDWLTQLLAYPSIYTFLVSEACSFKVLYTLHKRSQSSTATLSPKLNSISISKRSLLENPSPDDFSSNKPSLKPINLEQKLNNPSRNSVISNAGQPHSRLSISKPTLFDKNSPEAAEKFKEIIGSGVNIAKENLKDYLSKRYPVEILDIILKWVHHGISVNYETWILDMQKFVALPDEKHLKMAFEIYDFNKDKLICSNDAFHAITCKENNFFSQDLVKIRGRFLQQGSEGLLVVQTPGKAKNLSLKKQLVNAGRLEMLNFESFCKIKFAFGKPFIVFDIVNYLIGLDLSEGKLARPHTNKRKDSAKIVKEMMYNPETRELLSTDKRFDYYLELETAMLSCNPIHLDLFLSNFNTLRNSISPSQFLSQKSLSKSWAFYFGSENPYLLQSFYTFLAGKKNFNISTSRFLQKTTEIFEVFFKQNEDLNYFSFCIYDKNKDGFISCDELKEFFLTLSQDCYIYKECLM